MSMVEDPSILYSNSSQTTFLIDIPHSIAVAQHEPSSLPSSLRLPHSTVPISTPYPSTEPKNAATFLKLTQNLSVVELELHQAYVDLIELALLEVRHTMGTREWCFPRIVAPSDPRDRTESGRARGKKRKRKWHTEAGLKLADSDEAVSMEQVGNDEGRMTPYCGSVHCVRKLTRATLADCRKSSCLAPHYNQSDKTEVLIFDLVKPSMVLCTDRSRPWTDNVADDASEEDNRPRESSYTIPPYSAFLSSPASDKASFQHLTSVVSPDRPLRFPFILLDPPWPNRSVLRSSSYATPHPRNLHELRKLLLGMTLGDYLEEEGYVAVWVTNKAVYRDVVVGSGSLFEQLGIEIVEEWIWVKVTTAGDPVTELKGLWRKPYEVCIIGRKGECSDTEVQSPRVCKSPARRVLFGVPDLHSRKPCLMGLVKSILTGDEQRRGTTWGLEIFARYCTAQWLAWGDEAVLFNRSDGWD